MVYLRYHSDPMKAGARLMAKLWGYWAGALMLIVGLTPAIAQGPQIAQVKSVSGQAAVQRGSASSLSGTGASDRRPLSDLMRSRRILSG